MKRYCSNEKQSAYSQWGLNSSEYGLVTLHRPSNVDDVRTLKKICRTLMRIAGKIPLVFPIHPRTRKNLENLKLIPLISRADGLNICEPLNYIHFMNLVFNCRLAITDSGGIQEETTYLGIPCLTLRSNTERPVTIEQGTNKLCDIDHVEEHVDRVLAAKNCAKPKIELWDGHTADRVVASIKKLLK